FIWRNSKSEYRSSKQARINQARNSKSWVRLARERTFCSSECWHQTQHGHRIKSADPQKGPRNRGGTWAQFFYLKTNSPKKQDGKFAMASAIAARHVRSPEEDRR